VTKIPDLTQSDAENTQRFAEIKCYEVFLAVLCG